MRYCIVLPISQHAQYEMEHRGISEAAVRSVFEQPQQKISLAGSREIWQNRIVSGGKTYVLRIIVDLAPSLKIVTVYKSSKIKKYWRDDK